MKNYIFLIGAIVIALVLATQIVKPKDNLIIEITYTDLTKDAKKQVDCLAENIYREAGVESEKGKQAVALVTMNRTQDPRFPSDICSVVKQKVKRTCQFSWFCESHKAIDKRSDVYQTSMKMALFVYANYEMLHDITKGALYYHADYVNPRWRGLTQTTKIGRHIFYKET